MTDTTPPSTTPTPAKKRGSNKQPSQRHYRPSRSASRMIKKATEQYQTLRGPKRLSGSEKSMLAFFTYPLEREGGGK